MHFHFIPYSVLLFASSCAMLLLALYGIKQRELTGAKFFVASMFVGIIWVLGNSLEIMGTDLRTKLFWANLQYLSYAFAPEFWLFMVFQFSGHENWVRPRTILILSIIPVLTSVFVWLDPFLGLVRRNIVLSPGSSFSVIRKDYGPWFWVHFAHCYILNTFSLVLLFGAIWRKNKTYHRQAIFLLIGLILIMLPNVLYITGLSAIRRFDISPVSSLFSALIIAWGIFRHYLFDLVPIAREQIFEKMSSGAIVTDPKKRILDINERAKRMFHVTDEKVIGKNVEEQIPVLFPPNKDRYREILLEEGSHTRYFEVTLSPLKDYRENLAGWLFLVNDITGLHYAQEQLLCQQRELAVVEEQHRVARDLHDNIGQILSFTGIQVQTIQREIQRNNIETATDYLQRLASVTDQTYNSLREYVFNLRSPKIKEIPFRTLLEKYVVEDFKNTDISLKIEIDPRVEPLLESAEKKNHLVSLTKEAINNSVKHSGASEIIIEAIVDQTGYEYSIEDNGKGFPKSFSENSSPTSGVKIMKERALLSGGEMRIFSSPGKGTRICVYYSEEGKI